MWTGHGSRQEKDGACLDPSPAGSHTAVCRKPCAGSRCLGASHALWSTRHAMHAVAGPRRGQHTVSCAPAGCLYMHRGSSLGRDPHLDCSGSSRSRGNVDTLILVKDPSCEVKGGGEVEGEIEDKEAEGERT